MFYFKEKRLTILYEEMEPSTFLRKDSASIYVKDAISLFFGAQESLSSRLKGYTDRQVETDNAVTEHN